MHFIGPEFGFCGLRDVFFLCVTRYCLLAFEILVYIFYGLRGIGKNLEFFSQNYLEKLHTYVSGILAALQRAL